MNFKLSLRYFCILSFLMALSACGGGQEEELTLSKGQIDYDFHKNNIGKIFFMDSWIPSDSISETDNLQHISLSEGSEFYLRLLPQYSQTYYLNQLASELSPNELCKRGNWSVKFYVDDKYIYQDNISPGGGSCFYRNKYASVVVPIVANDENNANHWGAFLWKRFFYKENFEKLFKDGSHKLTLEFRPYIKIDGEIKYGEIVAKGSVNLSLKEIAEYICSCARLTEEKP